MEVRGVERLAGIGDGRSASCRSINSPKQREREAAVGQRISSTSGGPLSAEGKVCNDSGRR